MEAERSIDLNSTTTRIGDMAPPKKSDKVRKFVPLKVMGPCAGSDGDLLFEKNSVGLTHIEKFSYGTLFNSGKRGTNGWKTADYQDPKSRAIALGIMYILRSHRTTKVPQPKTSEELVKELILSEEILEQVVAQVGGTVVDADDITLPSSHVEDVRPEVEKKTSEYESKGVEVTFPDFLHDSVVPLLKYLDGKREKYVVSK
ncbi:hypothetical protein AXG93_4876s1140 [Marchantia polymorpha subsp. ruderalis]|uniref:Uncharacterized protein n=1 Tax=Marchantia polymorpha subsp. ruderalis TaxID=1480154 RepID=A0A176WDP4_MARPO|nr:hypothetical protein AXG93_4876s1140 [Marchantia polymorpha subsp. ruderalis]